MGRAQDVLTTLARQQTSIQPLCIATEAGGMPLHMHDGPINRRLHEKQWQTFEARSLTSCACCRPTQSVSQKACPFPRRRLFHCQVRPATSLSARFRKLTLHATMNRHAHSLEKSPQIDPRTSYMNVQSDYLLRQKSESETRRENFTHHPVDFELSDACFVPPWSIAKVSR